MNNNFMNIFLQMMGMGNTPQQIMQKISQNPQYQRAFQEFQQMQNSGKSFEQMAREYAQANNININQVVNMMKNNHRF